MSAPRDELEDHSDAELLAELDRRARSRVAGNVEQLPGAMCPSCEAYDDLISLSCGGPVNCVFACPHVDPERAKAIADELGPVLS